MLSPNDGRHIVLLPQDRQIMELTGMDEAEYRWFCRQAISHSKLRPGEPIALFDPVSIGIQLVIGAALTYASTLLTPRSSQPAIGQPEVREVQGQKLVNGARYTPKAGFDSVQNVVEMGSTIPLIYTKRQVIDGVAYGGVRVNTDLLWSQTYSVGGGQMLRAVFMIGEGNVEAVDPTQFAIGNNILSGYDLQRRNAGRICIYYRGVGGRLVATDYLAGVEPSEDVGNAMNDGAADVFQVRGKGDEWTTNFCYTSKPSNQTRFGLYNFIGSNFPFRINPTFRPAVIAQTRADGELNCKEDGQQRAARQKQDFVFSGRSGLTKINGTAATGQRDLEVGDKVEFTLYGSSDADRKFIGVNNGEATCTDVAQSISARQRSNDEQLNYGDLYRIGSAFGICISRTPEPFASNADRIPSGGGSSVTAIFEITRRGICNFYSRADLTTRGGVTATEGAHLMQAAEAFVSAERAGRIFEIGIRSQLQVNISGLCSFKDGRGYEKIDQDACIKNDKDPVDSATLINFISGNYSTVETRYSFWRVAHRVAGTDDEWINIKQLFGVRSTTGVAAYNYLRIEFFQSQRPDIRLTPVSGWEIRNNIQPGELVVLDAHMNNRLSVYTPPEPGIDPVTVQFTGEVVSRSQGTFGIPSFNGGEVVGNGFEADDQGFMVDAWARLAEGFIYNEVTATTTEPEHEIVYINTITENNTGTPKYDDMAIVGINIRSSKEISSFDQFSAYTNEGINATSNFPEVLYDVQTSKRYGAGNILSPAQIDKQSYDEATRWAYDRRYFFDGAISEKINIRTWGKEIARLFLLDLIDRNGKFSLKPVANFYGPEEITGLFTAGNIIEGSFEFNYIGAADRVPPRVSVLWREEREIGFENSKGLFPVVREVTVREGDTPEDAPLITVDMSDFCTSQKHAIDVAKWECRKTRLMTSTPTFKVIPTEAALDLVSVFKLGMETVKYDQPANGAVSSTGEVTSWPPLDDGTYPVLLWDGKSRQPEETDMIIRDGKSLSNAGAVFCVRSTETNVPTFKVVSLGFDEDGNIDVEANAFPTDQSGNSEMAANWDLNWIIEGVG